MEGMFRQIGIWNQDGQNYVPQDADQMMFYKETKERPDPAGRHQRGRRHGRLDRRRHQLLARTACR
jgi:predicted transposase YdaD